MCMIDDSDGYVTVLSERRPVARRPHRCNECRRTIKAGETYLREATVHEGEFGVHKTCRHCQVAREWLQAECGGSLYGGIEEDIVEHVSLHGIGVMRLAAGMQCQWTRKDGRLWPVPPLPPTTK